MPYAGQHLSGVIREKSHYIYREGLAEMLDCNPDHFWTPAQFIEVCMGIEQLAFHWPNTGFSEEDFTLDFIYDLHMLLAIDGPNEFANMLVFHDLELYINFCDKWEEYNETKYWLTKESSMLL